MGTQSGGATRPSSPSPSSSPPASTSSSTSSSRFRVLSPQATSPQHLLTIFHSWRNQLTRQTWRPPSTSSSLHSRSSTPASSSTQSFVQSDFPSESNLTRIEFWKVIELQPKLKQPKHCPAVI